MKSTLLATLMAIVAAAPIAIAQTKDDWTPVKGGLMTRWAKDVDPKNPLTEYPRPTMVRQRWMSLNGLWEYQTETPQVAGAKSQTGSILVPYPYESALSGVKGASPGPGLQYLRYRRSFTVPAEWGADRVLLHFGAVNWRAEVMVNNRAVGTHEGGYDPFTIDITDALKPGTNELLVQTWNPGNSGGQPRGKQFDKSHSIWYTASSGIWQTVWLEPVPRKSIAGVTVKADRLTGKVSIEVRDSLQEADNFFTYEAEVSRDGKTIARKRAPDGSLSLDIPSPHAWTPDDPYLYDLTVRTFFADRLVDEVKSYFAFRDVGLMKDDQGFQRLTLNGVPVFHYGPLDQGFWPDGLYTAPTDEALKSDILAAKRMGCNMIRKHVKVEPERWYYWCDTLGMMVWQDMPSAFFKTTHFDEGFPEISDKWKANYERELKAMIEARKQHPCIVMWVPWNEGWGQQDMDWAKAVAESCKKMDPTRLVNNATGWTDMGVGDTRDIHAYPEPAMVPIERDAEGKLWGGRAAVLGEFGGLGLPLEGHTWVNKDNWGYRTYKTKDEVTEAYVGLMEQMPALIAQGLSAAVYTQTTDVEIECNGWMTYDREVWKIDPDKAKAATMAMYAKPPALKVVLAGANQSPADARQVWAYTTSFPELDWYRRDFKATPETWQSGPGGFGTEKTPGAIVGTWWSASDIWMRTVFSMPKAATNPYLSIHHDEDAEVYINGDLAAKLKGFTTGYQLVKLSKEAAALLKTGDNVLAIHCHQTTGGQYIDCGIVDVTPAE